MFEGTIRFVNFEGLVIEKEIIKSIYIFDKTSFCLTEEGKFIVGGYKEFDTLSTPNIFVINVKYKRIETIINYDFSL